MRAALEALVGFLKRFAAPTGARGSVLFMWGGLIIIGFLFLTFLFRSAIVGDLAPVANGRTPIPRALLPGKPAPGGVPALVPPAGKGARFEAGRAAARDVEGGLDQALATLHASGFDARILLSGRESKRLRAYRCPACAAEGEGACEYARGLLAGAFEAVTGELAKVEETACRREGAPHCEFEGRHAPFPEVAA